MYTNYREDYYAATAAAGEALSRQFAQALLAQLRRTARGFGFAPTWRPVYLQFCVQFLRWRHAARQLAAVFRCRHQLHSSPCCTLSHTVSGLVVIAQVTLPCLLIPNPCLNSYATRQPRLWATFIMQNCSPGKTVLQNVATTSGFLSSHVLPWRKSQASDDVRLQHSLHCRSTAWRHQAWSWASGSQSVGRRGRKRPVSQPALRHAAACAAPSAAARSSGRASTGSLSDTAAGSCSSAAAGGRSP
jgi:hypothetical protein